MEERTVRQSLWRVLDELDPVRVPLDDLVFSMNKWDQQYLEEPDYMHLLKTHKEINAILENGDPFFEQTAIALYNSFNFIRTVCKTRKCWLWLFACLPRNSSGHCSLSSVIAGISGILSIVLQFYVSDIFIEITIFLWYVQTYACFYFLG